MSNENDYNPFEPPWTANNESITNVFRSPAKAMITETILRLELLLRQRERLCCPNDDVDSRISSAVRYALDCVKSVTGSQNLTSNQQNSLIRNGRWSIKEAIDVIEKILKTYSP